MGRFLKFFLIALGAVILIGWVFFQSHSPKLRGKQNLAGLSGEVDVYFDDYGVPHIYAKNAADAYRTFGYVHAQDRLFQMEMMRRVGHGRLAEIFGEEFLKTDMFFRTLGTNRKAQREAADFEKLPVKLQEHFTAYLSGVNAYIREGKKPLEFVLLGIDPEPFTVEDMYAIAGYIAYSFSQSLRVDPLVEQIAEKFGPRYLSGFDLADLLPDTLGIEPLPSDSLGPNKGQHDSMNTAYATVPAGFGIGHPAIQNFRLPLPDDVPIPILEGSNAWVLAPSRTLSDKVIFANDTHIKYASPSVWYEAHIEYPGFGFYGNYLAGIPVALVGHSRSHAYGLTMFEDDDSDFFIERFARSDTGATVVSDTLTAPVIKIRETVAYGDHDTTFTVYQTSNGVLINDFLPFDYSEPIAMYWNYTAVETNLVRAFYSMQIARELEGFGEAVSTIGSPGLNVHYGDAAGNIALWAAGKIIKRPEGVGGKRFIPGHVDSLQYLGFYPFSQNPQIVNPDSGMVYSANQMHDSLEGGLYSGYYAPDTRFDRISVLLNKMKSATVDSVKTMTLDVVSKTEAAVAREIAVVILDSDFELDKTSQKAIGSLRFWNGRHELSDVEPTIYYKVLYHILRRTFVDELGNTDFDNLMDSHHFLTRSYPKFITRDEFPWWDNVKTGGKSETRQTIFVEAFAKAIEELKSELGDNMEKWTWNRVHFIEHPHPFGTRALLKPLFNVGPFPAPGGVETINNSGFRFNGEGRYISNYGPAMRIIIDFADVENAVSVLPTGNSGNVLSPYYSDQAQMFVKGEFRKMMMNETEIKKSDNRLIFSSGEQ